MSRRLTGGGEVRQWGLGITEVVNGETETSRRGLERILVGFW